METVDYSTSAARVKTARRLSSRAMDAKASVLSRWDLLYEYYRGEHRTARQVAESFEQAGIPWVCATSNDPYIHVESLITSELPDFEFHGRDDDLDSEKARQRELVVRYISEREKLDDLAPMSDRRSIITGSSAWKVYWDGSDVRVSLIDPRSLYPDPDAVSLDDCEFVSYCYSISIRELLLRYGDELKRLNADIRLFDCRNEYGEIHEGRVTLCEHWYKNEQGDISLSVICNDLELSHTDNYWQKTGSLNHRFPFVIFSRIPDPDSIWGNCELQSVIPLVDAIDRELSVAQINSAFYGADIILAEHDAFSEEPCIKPGALWRLKPGAIGKVARLGGLGNISDRFEAADKLRELIKQSIGNFDIDMGYEPSKVTSGAGISILVERSELRRAPQKRQLMLGYRNLYELIDLTALEFYEGSRTLYIGAGNYGAFEFDPNAVLAKTSSGKCYIPVVDAVCRVTDSLSKSKSFILSTLEAILGHSITKENYMLAQSVINMLDLPNGREICENLEKIMNKEDENNG